MGRKLDEVSIVLLSNFLMKMIFEVPHGQIDSVQHILSKSRTDFHFGIWSPVLQHFVMDKIVVERAAFDRFQGFLQSSKCKFILLYIQCPLLQWDTDLRLQIILYFLTVIIVKYVFFKCAASKKVSFNCSAISFCSQSNFPSESLIGPISQNFVLKSLL